MLSDLSAQFCICTCKHSSDRLAIFVDKYYIRSYPADRPRTPLFPVADLIDAKTKFRREVFLRKFQFVSHRPNVYFRWDMKARGLSVSSSNASSLFRCLDKSFAYLAHHAIPASCMTLSLEPSL